MDLRTAHPDQPWLWRADWAAGEIHASPKARAIGYSLLALFWNVCAYSAVAKIPTISGPDRTKTIVWLSLFPLIGVGILLSALRALFQWRWYGQSTLQLKAVPGAIGGALEGAIRCAHPFASERAVKLQLTCVHTTRGPDGKIADVPIWSDRVETAADPDGTIPVAFYIPPECRPTVTEPVSDRVTWKLIAAMTANPVSYSAHFVVPVFAVGGESSARPADAAELRARRAARVNAYEAPEHSRVRVTLGGDGATEVVFPAFRNPGVALSVVGFLALWGVLTVVIFKDDAPLVFKILWPVFDVLIGIWGVLLVFGSTSVRARQGEMTIVWRVLGIPVHRRHLSASEISEIGNAPGMYAGNTVYRRIQVRRNGRNPLNFGDGIPDSIEADWLASKITQAVGLPEHREGRA